MLTLELRLHPLGPFDRSHPPKTQFDALSHRVLVLDLDVVLHHVAVRVEPQGLRDAKTEPVLTDQLHLPLASTLRQPERFR